MGGHGRSKEDERKWWERKKQRKAEKGENKNKALDLSFLTYKWRNKSLDIVLNDAHTHTEPHSLTPIHMYIDGEADCEASRGRDAARDTGWLISSKKG